MVTYRRNGVVIGATIKHHAHRTILQCVVLAVNSHNCALRLNHKDHKLRLGGCCIDILTERDFATIDLYFLLVADIAISQF